MISSFFLTLSSLAWNSCFRIKLQGQCQLREHARELGSRCQKTLHTPHKVCNIKMITFYSFHFQAQDNINSLICISIILFRNGKLHLLEYSWRLGGCVAGWLTHQAYNLEGSGSSPVWTICWIWNAVVLSWNPWTCYLLNNQLDSFGSVLTKFCSIAFWVLCLQALLAGYNL